MGTLGEKKMMHCRLNARNLLTCIMTGFLIYIVYKIWAREDPPPPVELKLADVISYSIMAVRMGGHAVVAVNNDHRLNVQQKAITDEGKYELLTKADLVSNSLMLSVFERLPLVKIVSEEKSSSIPEDVEKYRISLDNDYDRAPIYKTIGEMSDERYALSRLGIWIDPLDATQEFTEGLLEYVTVMACVTVDDKPIFGAIYRPFYNESVFGLVGHGLYNMHGEKIATPNLSTVNSTIVVSRSHAGKVKDLAAKAYGEKYIIEPAGGSGYKTLRLVNGTAALYVHTTAIKKWDVCAADAIIRAAGGALLDLQGQRLTYSPKDEVLNKNGLFVAIHNPFEMLLRFKTALR